MQDRELLSLVLVQGGFLEDQVLRLSLVDKSPGLARSFVNKKKVLLPTMDGGRSALNLRGNAFFSYKMMYTTNRLIHNAS